MTNTMTVEQICYFDRYLTDDEIPSLIQGSFRLEPSLSKATKKHNQRLGFATDVARDSDGKYWIDPVIHGIIRHHASILVPENAGKMMFVNLAPYVYDFDPINTVAWQTPSFDALLEYTRDQNLDIVIHATCAPWHMQNPEWLDNGTYLIGQLRNILKDYVSNWAAHMEANRDIIVSMDIANEAHTAAPNLGAWTPLGLDYYARTSFNRAARASNIPRVYNTFDLSKGERKWIFDLLENFVIDGVGIQLGLEIGKHDIDAVLADAETLIRGSKRRGGFVRLSEVRVWHKPEEEALQAEVWGKIIELALKYKRCVRDVVSWGVKDSKDYYCLLFDEFGNPKKSFWKVYEAYNR